MQARWLLPLLVLVALAGTATASHDAASIPLLDEGPSAEAIGWLADERVTSEGCVHGAYDQDCIAERTKWLVVSLAHAGVDAAAWPDRGASSLDWLRDRSDDLRDEALVACQDD